MVSLTVQQSQCEYSVPKQELFRHLLDQPLTEEQESLLEEVSQPKAKKRKVAQRSVDFVRYQLKSVEELSGSSSSSSEIKVPVSAQLSEPEDTEQKLLTISYKGTPLLKLDLHGNTCPENGLKIIAAKCTEFEIKQANARLRLAAKANGAKGRGRKKRTPVATTRVPNTYKEVSMTPMMLAVNQDGDWHLQTTLTLSYLPDSNNVFSEETNSLLDELFCPRREHFLDHAPGYLTIEKDFGTQAARYTKQVLTERVELPPIDGLNTSLLPYQKQSVHWMLQKEGYYGIPYSAGNDEELRQFLNTHVSYGYETLMPVDSAVPLFWNKFSGFVLTSEEAWDIYNRHVKEQIVEAKGILSDDTGLGKTVETLALVCLHRRKFRPDEPRSYTLPEGREILKAKTTLICCPGPILQQWLDEAHIHTKGSALSVFYYCGYDEVKKQLETENIGEISRKLAEYDVIVADYGTISFELTNVGYSTVARSRRSGSPKYDYTSPLSLLEFYRIAYDEVELLYGDSSPVSKCTRLLARVHTWGVSSTPIGDTTNFQMVLSFLKFHPFEAFPNIITNVSTNVWLENRREEVEQGYHHWYSPSYNKTSKTVNGIAFGINDLFDVFVQCNLCIKHTRDSVSDQLVLTAQHNYLIPLDLSPVEREDYQEVWEEFLNETGFDENGNHVLPNHSNTPWTLSRWLESLLVTNGTCLLTSGLRRTANSTSSAEEQPSELESMHSLVDTLCRDVSSNIELLEKKNLEIKVRSAHTRLESEKKPREVIGALEESRAELLTALKERCGVADPFSSDAARTADDGEARVDSKLYFELLHMCYATLANAYSLLGSAAPEKTAGRSTASAARDLKQCHRLEKEYRDGAGALEKAILAGVARDITRQAEAIKREFEAPGSELATELALLELPLSSEFSKRASTEQHCADLQAIFDALNKQRCRFEELFAQLKELCYKPVAGCRSAGVNSLKADQKRMFALLNCLKIIAQNRDAVASSVEQLRPAKTLASFKAFSKAHKTMFLDLALFEGAPLRVVLHVVSNAKVAKLLASGDSGIVDNTPEDELSKFIESAISSISKEAGAVLASLDKFEKLHKSREGYLKRVQETKEPECTCTSTVKSGAPASKKTMPATAKDDEAYAQNLAKINSLYARTKYLKKLSKLKEEHKEGEELSCAVCFNEIFVGSVVKCGHFFCYSCIHTWLKEHNTCPLCKTNVTPSEVYNFRYKEGEELPEDGAEEAAQESGPFSQKPKPVYYGRYKKYPRLDLVKQMGVRREYCTKIDFAVKLVTYLKVEYEQKVKASKCQTSLSPPQILVYSNSFMAQRHLSEAFKAHSISHFNTEFGQDLAKEAELFKRDSSITCLLMNPKWCSRGLKLTNATHVILMEPMSEGRIQEQAVERIHRIGQGKDTFVWHLMTRNTAEESTLKYRMLLEEKNSRERLAAETDREAGEGEAGEEEVRGEGHQTGTTRPLSDLEVHCWNCLFGK